MAATNPASKTSRRNKLQPIDFTASSRDIKAIENCLDHLLSQKQLQASRINPYYGNLIQQIKTLVNRGGKRLRPQVTMATYEAYGGNNRRGIVRVAASQELFHAYILMHDDIIDRDLIRWGGLNISGHYEQALSQQISDTIDRRHFADSFALLAGDLCFNLSLETLLQSGFASYRLSRAVALVQQTLFIMIGGELDDVATPLYTPLSESVSDQRLLALCDAKTASYTFSTPLRLGALLAGAPVSHGEKLAEFGKYLGIAFQLQDDILGIFGDSQQLGKSNLSDIQEGKRTLLMNAALRLATISDRQTLLTILGSQTAGPAELKIVQDIVQSCGALSEIKSIMSDYSRISCDLVLDANFPAKLNDYLIGLLNFCVERNY